MSRMSPGIDVNEINLTTIVPAVSSTTGGIAGVFAWGPVNEPTQITSEVDLVKTFGKPIRGFNEETFFTAADFLAYTNSLFVTRVDTGDAAAPTGGSQGALLKLTAKYPGSMGDSITVQILTNTTYVAADSTYDSFKNIVRRAPDTDHMHIMVFDSDGVFSGKKGSLLESYVNVSRNIGDKTLEGRNNYWADVINNSSRYIAVDLTGVAPDTNQLSTPVNASFVNGDDGDDEYTVSQGSLENGYNTFRNKEDINISLLMIGPDTFNGGIIQHATNIAERRMDAMVFASPKREAILTANDTVAVDPVTSIKTWANSVASGIGDDRVKSFLVLDSGYKYRYDRYNDRFIYTPLNGDIAGLCARTDNIRDPWFSPAGYNRGGIKNIVKLAFNPNQDERDELYSVSVNPVITETGQGTILFGDKTSVTTASAFDRINVRRLFIVLEEAISKAARSMMFEMNDEFTRAQFKNLVEPFLRDVQGRRGIYSYKVVCDESNNTPEIIDRNEFVGDIYVKPSRSINYIRLNFVSVRSGVEFDEIVGQN